MHSAKLISIGNFELRLHHLLVIGILAMSFSISFLLRSQAAEFGFELNEFDPFFNYRATQYIVDNGVSEYFEWRDYLSWYPSGRDVSSNAQVMLHLTAATTFWIFGGNSDLYDFAIIFPVVFGSLTAIVVFALVRVIGRTTAGLIVSLLYAVSIPILIRGPIGWFKSEPLGLFFSLLSVYLLLSGITSQSKKIQIAKLISAGIFTAFGLSAWGGNQFFIITVGVFFLALPFLRTDHKFIVWAIPLYTVITLVTSLGFERVGNSFVFGLGGISLIIPTIFLVACIFIQQKSNEKNRKRNGALLLISILIIGPSILLIDNEGDILPLLTHRYLNAINPLLTTTDPLVDSVSEHATTTTDQSFFFHSILMLFAGIGVWLILKNLQTKSFMIRTDMVVFALIIGIMGVYISSTFVRLEVFASISLIILSSLGLSMLIKEFFRNTNENKIPKLRLIKFPFAIGVIILLIVPMVYPVGGVATVIKGPPTILNGGAGFQIATNDWLYALNWIKNNTPKDAVVAAWWDYGYWISTMGERASLADNSTVNTTVIQKIAQMFLSSPDESWKQLEDMQADYVLVFVTAEKLNLDTPESFYTLGGGGDESKKQWFMRIAGHDTNQYLHADGLSGTDYFWNETLLGQMFPFSVLGYVNPNNIAEQYPTYVPGTVGIYGKDIKFPEDGDGPLRLVYASSSFTDEKPGPMIGVFIYEINKQYNPE